MSKEKICVIHENTDYSKEMSDFVRKPVDYTVVVNDYLYLGHSKPINQFYFNISTVNTAVATTTVEYYNGTAWVSVEDLTDNTYGFTESGFLCWEAADCDQNQTKTTINSTEKYFYRVSFDVEVTATILGIGVLFSDDSDIYIEYPILDNPKYRVAVSGNASSYANIHVQVRDYILSDIRNTGINKYTKDDPKSCAFFKQITEFDLFNIEEVRFAARMLAMSNIYYKLSDSPDDRWQIDAERYKAEYLRAFNVAFVSIDRNDDGKKEVCEQPTYSQNLRINR